MKRYMYSGWTREWGKKSVKKKRKGYVESAREGSAHCDEPMLSRICSQLDESQWNIHVVIGCRTFFSRADLLIDGKDLI